MGIGPLDDIGYFMVIYNVPSNGVGVPSTGVASL